MCLFSSWDSVTLTRSVTGLSPHHCDTLVPCCLPFPGTGIFASKCSALHEHHPEKQTHEALRSKHTKSGSQSLCLCALLASPFLRHLHDLGIAWPPTVSLLMSLDGKNRAYSSRRWRAVSSLCWSLSLSGGSGWIGDIRDTLSGAEARYHEYILVKAEVYMERWTDWWSISCFVLFFNKHSFNFLWFSALGAVRKVGKVHWVYRGLCTPGVWWAVRRSLGFWVCTGTAIFSKSTGFQHWVWLAWAHWTAGGTNGVAM